MLALPGVERRLRAGRGFTAGADGGEEEGEDPDEAGVRVLQGAEDEVRGPATMLAVREGGERLHKRIAEDNEQWT